MSKSENTIVITGAGGGIGLGLAEAFLREGYKPIAELLDQIDGRFSAPFSSM